MKKDCQLIATLPNLYNEKEIDKLLTCPLIYGARLNSGINNLMEPKQIADKLKVIKEKYHKRIWIDLKGRQLRVIAWANPLYEAIELNHEIEIEYPAKIVFRGSSTANILHTKKNKIILDRPPERAVGKGQSVNIIAKSLNIKGYLTKQDEELIKESKSVGLNDYMASFTESIDDIMDIKRLNSKAIIIPKIESKKGLDFATKYGQYFNLMAARDDLYSEIGNNIHMLKYLKAIIEKDKNAICASKIFSSLNSKEDVELADYEDLELMYNYGYRTFMLGDDIQGPKLVKALSAWKEFTNE